jgi:hypothetical protein
MTLDLILMNDRMDGGEMAMKRVRAGSRFASETGGMMQPMEYDKISAERNQGAEVK